MPFSKRLRYEILRRDNHACRYCGATAPDVKLTVDHVTPVALGGSDKPENLVAACAACNGGKTSSSPDAPIVADVDQRAICWSAAMQVAAERMLADQAELSALQDRFATAWGKWGRGEGEARTEMPKDPGWPETVERFLKAGLPFPVLLSCVERAMRNEKLVDENRFRYMCGIAWSKVTELQDAAREIADRPQNVTASAAGDDAPIEQPLVDIWLDRWYEARPDEDPEPSQMETLRMHLRAARGAGYEVLAIEAVLDWSAHCREPRVCQYLTTATDALEQLEWDRLRRLATDLWLESLIEQWGETYRPSADDLAAFATELVWIDHSYTDEQILEAAQLAGARNDGDLVPYLPRRTSAACVGMSDGSPESNG